MYGGAGYRSRRRHTYTYAIVVYASLARGLHTLQAEALHHVIYIQDVADEAAPCIACSPRLVLVPRGALLPRLTPETSNLSVSWSICPLYGGSGITFWPPVPSYMWSWLLHGEALL